MVEQEGVIMVVSLFKFLAVAITTSSRVLATK